MFFSLLSPQLKISAKLLLFLPKINIFCHILENFSKSS